VILKRYVFVVVTLFALLTQISASGYSSGIEITLKRDGWNLVAICQDMNASDIDMTNIEEIQDQNGNSIYTGEFAQYSNLKVLKAGYGYWVKSNKGVKLKVGQSISKLSVPLKRDGWNLIGICQDIPKESIDMSSIQEIQEQSGNSIYTGVWAQYSDLEELEAGYGYWIKGSQGNSFIVKKSLSIPDEFIYKVINNSAQEVQKVINGYTIKLFSKDNIEADAQQNHTGIVIKVEDVSLDETLHIQSNYIGKEIVVGIYDSSNTLVGVSKPTVVSDQPVTYINTIVDSSLVNLDYLINSNEVLVVTKVNENITVDLSKIKTIKCYGLSPKDKFIINGIEYEVVDNNSIKDEFREDYEHICTSFVTDMSRLFYNMEDFNQSIGKWDTYNVTDMSYMFYKANSFNQDVSSWNVSKVKNMSCMFCKATAFNQDIGDWDISSIEHNQHSNGLQGMFSEVTLSTYNYSNILNKWSKLPLKNSIVFDAGGSKYTQEANASRQSIIDNFNWTIIDGGMETDTTPPSKPTLTTQPPVEVTDNNFTIEVNGEVGAKVYVNGEEIATVDSSGKVLVNLTLTEGDNSFSITLRDNQGNESEALNFVVIHNHPLVIYPKYTTKKNHPIDIEYKPNINMTASLVKKPMHGSVEIKEVKQYSLPTAFFNDRDSFYEYNNSYINQDSDLIIIGLYEASSKHYDSNGNHIIGETEVNISKGGDKPITLVFSSYEPVHWKLSVEDGVNINKIILNGYYKQVISGVDQSLVENLNLHACGYSLPYNGGGCDTNILIHKIEELTNLKLSKFIGTYRSSSINIKTSNGEVINRYSKIIYTPSSDYTGKDSFELQFVNSIGETTNKLINIDVIEPIALKNKTSKNFINRKYVIDLDGDGDLDVLEASTYIQWNENNGTNFIKHILPFKGTLVFAADMDNDGDIDIVSNEGTSINLYKNNGYQQFKKSLIDNRPYHNNGDSSSIYLADMDNDGDMDVVAAWMSQDWYENNGDGKFTKHKMNGDGGKDIIVADVDGDGDMDYIESDNEVIWFENNGKQSFTSDELSPNGGASAYATDIDKDGDIDIISVGRWSNQSNPGVELYINNGNKTFSKKTISSNKFSSYIYATDVDKDGFIDILNGTVWFKNDGSNNFIKQSSISLTNSRLITFINE